MRISDAEWRVMRVVWANETTTAARVIDVLLPQTGWSHRTVRTLLGRLVKKGILNAQRDGDRNIYRPNIDQMQCVRQATRAFLNKIFDGDITKMLTHLVESEELSPVQIHRLMIVANATKTRQA